VIPLKYLDSLRKDNFIQHKIEGLLVNHKSQPVGWGYIDIITSFNHIKALINELTNIGVAVNGVTWWCHCSEENKIRFGCPHGMGGPSSIFFNGWFSEMGIEYDSFDISQETYDQYEYGEATQEEVRALNDSLINYIFDFKNNDLFEECFYPAIWLHVPREWKRLKTW